MRRFTTPAALLALALATGFALPSTTTQDEPTPLQEAMGTLQTGQRALRKLVQDPAANRDALLGTLASMQGGALTAYGIPPAAPDGKSEAEQHAWRIGFQRRMIGLVDALLAMELATYEQDAEALSAGYGTLGDLKKAGHDLYQ